MLRKYFMSVSCIIALALFALLVTLSGCASVADKSLTIDPRHVVAMQDMRSEITSMLEGLGYQWQPIPDPVTGQPVQVIVKYDQYWMLFRAADNASVQVDVHIRQNDNITALHFSEVGAEQPSETAMDYYRKLKARVMLQFGAENVNDKHSFRTP